MTEVSLYRFLLLLVPLLLTGVLLAWRRSSPRFATAALFAFLWQLPALLVVQLLVNSFGWWQFQVDDLVLLKMPVDVWLGWALWWGPVLFLALPRINLIVLLVFAIWIDLLVMPQLSPLLRLSSNWLWGEVVALILVFLPGQLLARWTVKQVHLGARVCLLVMCFIGLGLFVLPTVILQSTNADWSPVLTSSYLMSSVMLLILTIPAVMGLSAVQEFYSRGQGTPIPYDPPLQLVTSGPFAYVANPMQLSTAIIWLIMGFWLQSFWVAAIAVMAVVFGVGLADWEERTALRKRVGFIWDEYRKHVRNWRPCWQPNGMPMARLYIASNCGPCEQLAAWLKQRGPMQLEIIAAQSHPNRDLIWITYSAVDSPIEEEGIVALARALEHLNFVWAWLGWYIRLPLVSNLAQLLLEVCFEKPLSVCKRTDTHDSTPSEIKD